MDTKARTGVLRPAAELAAERASRYLTGAEKNKRESLDEIARKIETAHRRGFCTVCVLTLPSDVVDELKTAGYNVKLDKAAGMGDVDTHIVSWL